MKLPVHALPCIGTAAPREGRAAARHLLPIRTCLASPAGPISLICHAAGSATGTVLSLDSSTSATSASANSEQESDVLVLSVA